MAEDKDKDLNENNAKDKFINRVKGFEAGFLKKPKEDFLSKIISKNFSKIEIYAMLKYPKEVFDYVGYFGK